MKIALCNEVVADRSFAAQCGLAAALGYDGLEIAPYTLGPEPHRLAQPERRRVRDTAAAAGIEIVGLHWLLVAPKGLSITSPDAELRTATVEVMRGLIDLCADLGGKVLVHGSPQQRAVAPGETVEVARARAADCWAAVARDAERAGVVYCIEPLSRDQTQVVNTVEEAAEIVRAIGSPAVRTMIDTSSAGPTETLAPAALIDRWLPTGLVAHIQVNDRNREGPGQGRDRFAPVFAALRRNGYAGVVSVEPFIYRPDGPVAAARAIGYIRGLLEAAS